ncbi:microcephalin-like [Babylonia areolata]|uniref:microcephalin-like n=1 Tax=Babylonia areolata TaxID=304850 RepID=UPI003FD15082
MGAKVEEKFSDDVTHVIFKEGKKRTLDKAQKLGVHLVSVLWVDSCKEKQQRVSEHEFSANTKHCGTPPPGIRWKKYKSMQPRDFEDELARSADRCQKRQRKNDKYWQLLQGEESATLLHSTAHVLVVDTQPRSPFASLDLYSPVIIPGTPPSMQARLNQLIQEKVCPV